MRAAQCSHGFTLVEVMIALVVFAVLGFTVADRVGDVVNQTYSMERRTVAHWVGSNHMNRLRVARRATRDPIDSGRSRERVTMGGREWLLEVDIQDTSQPTFKRVEIDVFELQGSEEVGPIDHLTAFVGQF